MAFDSEQKVIAKAVVLALAVTIAVIFSAGHFNLFEASEIKARIELLGIGLAPLALALFGNIARLANHRFAEPLDRNAAAASSKTAKAGMLSAILRNTHEQVTFAALVYAIAAFALPGHWIDAIIGSAGLFLIGRLIFAAGYSKGAGGRAFGFGLTFYPTVALAILTAVTVFN